MSDRALALLTLVASLGLHAQTTLTFQNGVNGYSGSKDFAINTQYSQYNGGNGVPWRGDPELGCYTTTGSGAYTARYLLKFGGISIPAGARVASATLTLSVDSWNSGSGNLTGFYLKNAWNPDSTRLGWVHRNDTQDWSAGGASAAGTDTVSGKSFQLPALRPVGVQTVTIALDRDLVQAWLDAPANNQGIMLVNNNPGEIIRIVSTAGTQSRRPKLTILTGVVSGVQVGISPTAASLQAGQQQTFAATVTGSSNTAVTWSATGGTITTAGVYTAGQAAGSFIVKATSVADPTKSATAQVTVSATPVVSVSISPTAASLQTGGTRQFTATVTNAANAAVTWSATGGTITSSGFYTAGASAGSFTVTATSVQDPTKLATAQVTVSATPAVSVSISPTAASLLTGGTRQFTATVTNAANTAVTWTATGGTITSSGLYTAGASAGSFTVTATSVQDPTKSAPAAVTITAPQPVSVSIAPPTATVFTGGTQQFSATVSNAANAAVTWSATGGAITSSGLYTAGASVGSFTVTATSVQDPSKSATAAVTVMTATSFGRPRIILDASTLTTLRSRAQARTAEWTALVAVCNSYIGGGTVLFPGENGYPNRPSVGEGYQGSGYVDALMPLGLCYQTTLLSDPTNAARYAAKGVEILMAMSDPNHTIVDGRPVWDRDAGYGIRNFGVGMGIGYDWFHAAMTSAQRSQVQTSLSNWINGFENDSFEYDHPQGNYFAGYYAAKCMAALAVQGDNSLGDTWWNDWYNHQHLQRLAPYYAANMAGGGWTEGFTQYGSLGSRNQALPALAVKTAKGIDLIHAAQPYAFPLDQARYLMAFTWPSRDMMDDRGELYDTGDPAIWPGTTNTGMYRFFAGYLSMWSDPLAPMMHRYARDVKTSLDVLHEGGTDAWIDFLFWDPSAPDAPDYSALPLSYLAPGVGGVAARSDWSNSATFLTFMSAPYVNNPAAGHEPFDKGSFAIERNKNPLVVNPAAWLTHEPNGGAGWTATFDDRFGNWSANHNLGNRTLYNTFQVRHLAAGGGILSNYGQWAMQRSDGARTKVARHEDGGSYVLTVGQFLEDMYRPLQSICTGRPPVSSWSRQIIYLRPSQVVVYDRTGICDASLDQYMAFHFPANPVEGASPGSGVRRFDVNPGTFAGSMTTILPANAATVTTSQLSTDTRTWNKLWRTEVRPTGAAAASRQWLTVFDLAATPGQVAAATAVNVTSGQATGALLQSASGNSVVLAGTAAFGTAISGGVSYVVPAAVTRHVVTDLSPSTGYSVSVVVSGGSHLVSIAAGGSRTASANGVLTFEVSAGGQVTP